MQVQVVPSSQGGTLSQK